MSWELVIFGLLIFQLVLTLVILKAITNLLRDIAREKCRDRDRDREGKENLERQNYLQLQKPTEAEITAREIRREQALGEREKQKQEHKD